MPRTLKIAGSCSTYEATATDNSKLKVKITYDKDPGSKFEIGITTVKVTATDIAGN